jgi:hypothetical protein
VPVSLQVIRLSANTPDVPVTFLIRNFKKKFKISFDAKAKKAEAAGLPSSEVRTPESSSSKYMQNIIKRGHSQQQSASKS